MRRPRNHGWHLIPEFLFLRVCLSSLLCAQSGSAPTVRWQSQSTQIYFDNIETVAPSLGSAFSLGPSESLTTNPSEVITGNESIKGSYSGTASYTPFLQTNPSVLAFMPSHRRHCGCHFGWITVRVSFQPAVSRVAVCTLGRAG